MTMRWDRFSLLPSIGACRPQASAALARMQFQVRHAWCAGIGPCPAAGDDGAARVGAMRFASAQRAALAVPARQAAIYSAVPHQDRRCCRRGTTAILPATAQVQPPRRIHSAQPHHLVDKI